MAQTHTWAHTFLLELLEFVIFHECLPIFFAPLHMRKTSRTSRMLRAVKLANDLATLRLL